MFPAMFGKKKLLLAFEYGVILSQVAKSQNIELTPEIVARAEEMIEREFRRESPAALSLDMEPLLLSLFETDMTK